MQRATLMMVAAGLVRAAVALGQEKPNTPAPAEPPPSTTEPKPATPTADLKPRELLQRAADIAKRTKVVQYDAVMTTAPSDSAPNSGTKGRVLLSGWNQERPDRFRYDLTLRRGKTGTEARVVVGCDGTSYYVIEHDNKAAYVGDEPKSLGTYQIMARFFPVLEFVDPAPYGKEIRGEVCEYRGIQKSGGEECHVIFARHVGAEEEVTWYLAKKDLLPRMVERTRTGPTGARAQMKTEISNVIVNSNIDADAFRFKLPDGYQQHARPAP